MALVDNLLLGLYIGVLTGIFAAVIVYVLTILFTYLAGTKLPVNYALLIGLGVAGLAGGPRLLLRNPEILQSLTALVMLLVVMLISLFAHTKGQELGNALPPKHVVLGKLRSKTLSPAVVKQIGRFGHVEIKPVGEVLDMEGYPPLPSETREAIRADRWTFPADLPIAELEARLEETLQQDYDLTDAVVTITSDGHATISAAPPTGRLSRRVPDGKQAVTIESMLPAGIAAGDVVSATLDDTTVSGQVISARVDEIDPQRRTRPDDDPAVDDPERDRVRPPDHPADGAPAGGTGRVALAVDPDDVETVVAADLEKLYVRSRGLNREFELVSLLRRYDNAFRRLVLRPESAVLDRTLGELDLRNAHGVVVLALNRANRWRFAPSHATVLRPGDELFVTGPDAGIDALEEWVA